MPPEQRVDLRAAAALPPSSATHQRRRAHLLSSYLTPRSGVAIAGPPSPVTGAFVLLRADSRIDLSVGGLITWVVVVCTFSLGLSAILGLLESGRQIGHATVDELPRLALMACVLTWLQFVWPFATSSVV